MDKVISLVNNDYYPGKVKKKTYNLNSTKS